MIVPMKKLTLLCMPGSQDQTLLDLRALKVLHVEHLQKPTAPDLDQARSELDRAQSVLEALPENDQSSNSDQDVQQTITTVWNTLQENKQVQEELVKWQREAERISFFGQFDPQTILDLKQKNIYIQLFEVHPKELPETPKQAVRVITHQDRERVYFALFSQQKQEPRAARELTLPAMSLSQIQEKIASLQTSITNNKQKIRSLARERPKVVRAISDLKQKVKFLEIRSGMRTSRPVSFLQGYFPAEQENKIQKAARLKGWGIIIENPDEQELPPTLIRTPAWVRPIQSVFNMLGIVPGYREIDISAPFLLFLSLFFAMIVGDAGYGAIFLAFTFLGKKHFSQLPSYLFSLLLVMSICTLIWGILIGNYFGMSTLPGPLKNLQISWLSGQNADANLILFCFLIGAVHLSLGHFWQLLRSLPSLTFLEQAGWICTTWSMFFAARSLVLMQDFPGIMYFVFIIGILLIVFFKLPLRLIKGRWSEYVMLPLNIINNFVDLVSYIRLFAVGAATFAMANAFNQVAGSLGMNSILSGLIAAFILFLGHTLNILLAAMGVLVHGVRLNALEFAGHAGLQWKGHKYEPFK